MCNTLQYKTIVEVARIVSPEAQTSYFNVSIY